MDIKNGEFWNIPSIGVFSVGAVKNTLRVTNEQLRRAKEKHINIGELPQLWGRLLWLMVYDQESLRDVSKLVSFEDISVFYVRTKVLGIDTTEFATLLGLSKSQVLNLERGERRKRRGIFGRHTYLIKIILKLLSTRQYQNQTICRLLHFARFSASSDLEHEAVSHVRTLLVAPRSRR